MDGLGNYNLATATAATATATSAWFGLRYDYGDLATSYFSAVESFDSCFGFGLGAHFYESEST